MGVILQSGKELFQNGTEIRPIVSRNGTEMTPYCQLPPYLTAAAFRAASSPRQIKPLKSALRRTPATFRK